MKLGSRHFPIYTGHLFSCYGNQICGSHHLNCLKLSKNFETNPQLSPHQRAVWFVPSVLMWTIPTLRLIVSNRPSVITLVSDPSILWQQQMRLHIMTIRLISTHSDPRLITHTGATVYMYTGNLIPPQQQILQHHLQMLSKHKKKHENLRIFPNELRVFLVSLPIYQVIFRLPKMFCNSEVVNDFW